jgi:hypothetical protein
MVWSDHWKNNFVKALQISRRESTEILEARVGIERTWGTGTIDFTDTYMTAKTLLQAKLVVTLQITLQKLNSQRVGLH